ncbi:MAG: HAMP domain-containing histidine kinase [Bacteroidales bacterium]|nr:HAMP domain-containing histidine kinase [Bacteroidales bacterium]
MSLRLRSVLLLIALLIVGGSFLFTNELARRLAQEEHKRMEIWAEATQRFIVAEEGTDIDFVSQIIEDNTTIPVYVTDSAGKFLFSRNVREPKQHVAEFYARRIAILRETQTPIEVRIADDVVQYIYYDESLLLRQLHYFPYIQFSVIFLFVLIAIFALYTAQQSEQNRVWIGLTKETAHQLGTPLSSLTAWSQLLHEQYPEDALLPEMDKDIERLQRVAERFSKVGSEPELTMTDLIPVVEDTLDYMRTRTSAKISYRFTCDNIAIGEMATPPRVMVMLNKTLFEWVIENLCKNAIDAMSGQSRNGQTDGIQGVISVNIEPTDNKVYIDVADTGKGMDRKQLRKIFSPGYTTKKRGWGLGLSLAKRIVEQYHKGHISVKQSVPGEGTTFRIGLRKVSS